MSKVNYKEKASKQTQKKKMNGEKRENKQKKRRAFVKML